MFKPLLLAALAVACIAAPLLFATTSQATIINSHEVVVDTNTYTDGDPVPTNVFSGGFVSSTDLINGLAPSSTTITSAEGAGLAPVLTNGTWNAVKGGGAANSTEMALIHSSRSATYDLGSATDIGEIVVYGGWFDRNRDQQHLEIFYSTNNGGSYTSLHSFDYNDGTTPGIIWHRTSVFDNSSSTMVSGVTNLRFDWLGQEFGYTGYAEIDVFEAGAVPEPSSLALAGLGLIGLVGFGLRRRKR